MRSVLIPEGHGMADVMNPAQYASHHNATGFAAKDEMITGMTKKGGTMDGVPKPHDHYRAMVEHKEIDSTKRTERHDKVVPASKAYNTLAKSGYKGMPNNHGSPVIEGIYKPGGKR